MALLPRVGDHFGRYRIDAQIGRGGMGVVYSATDSGIGRRVALKVVASALGDSSEFRARFEREAAVLARLDSPHVIAIFDYGTYDGCPYIATQYVGGGDLGALLQERGPMPTALALRLCAQVADALHDAHRVGVVHRDVKPTNVLLRDADSLDLHAYLCDFGIARTATDGLTAPGAVAGTWSYLSPECGRGAPGTPSSDVYALGCLLWATLSGSPPYRGSDVEIAVAHQRAPIPRLTATDELSNRINHILQRSLAKDPAARYDGADQLRIDLLAASGLPSSGVHVAAVPPDQLPTRLPGSAPPGHLSLGSLPPRNSPPTPTPAPTRRSRRRASLLIAAGCVGVVAAVGGVVAVSRPDADPAGADPSGPSSAPSSSPATSGTTESPTDPTDPPDGRRDEGGPIRGDLDGDGVGEVTLDFFHTVPRAGGQLDTFTDRTVFTPTADTLEEGSTARVEDELPQGFGQDVVGDYDGDDVLETLVVQQFDKQARRLRLTVSLSSGPRIDTTVGKKQPTVFPAVADLDGDGGDDLVLQYYRDFEAKPTEFAGVVLGETAFAEPSTIAVVPYSPAQATFQVADIDGNGYADLVVQRETGRTRDFDAELQLTTYLGGPDGTRRGPEVRYVIASAPAVLAGDVDGDEDDEIVLAHQSTSGTLAVVDLRGDRLRRPTSAGAIPSAGTLVSVAGMADVNGDGLDDVVAFSEVSDRRAELLVAIADRTRFVGGGSWATWKRRFKTSKYFDNVTFLDQGLS